ncbi:uncharacterized protein N7515_008284 [Penicillium bovifimosum]|uniref:Uncharacterized protein n=1 Tax=Penicillium bovifimosum TaxID=126998 RepID=A0A9W9GN09_9EURO|nr:uncharacterized protein N7515_008284 [Penicillium bovifimosum]KAJ5124459.1 hypothetical protein N7515_008284 [Penicillium bovifimosum]
MLLIPFLGIFLGMTLWSQWRPIPGFTVPEMSFRQRLSGAVQLTLESCIVCGAVDTLMSQRSHFGNTHSGDPAVVSPADNHGYANTTDYLEISPEADTMPSWFPTDSMVPIPGLVWYSVGVTTSVPEEVVDIHTLESGPGQGLFVPLLCLVVWCFLQGPMALIANTRRLVSFGVRALAEWTLDYLEGQPQIARVQFVAEEDPTLYHELDFLIAGAMDIQDEALAWVLAANSRLDFVSHVSVLPHSGGIWVHRIPVGGEQARDRKSTCNTTTTYDGTVLCQHPWNAPETDAPEHHDTSSPAEVLSVNGAEVEGDGSPQKRKRKNRPSQAKRRRFKQRLLEASEKELEQAHPKPTVPASSAQGTPLAVSSSSTPLSALAPVFVPAFLAEQELQSGSPSPAPLSMQMGIDPPDDCGTGSHDNGAPPQRPFRRHRHRRRSLVSLMACRACIDDLDKECG